MSQRLEGAIGSVMVHGTEPTYAILDRHLSVTAVTRTDAGQAVAYELEVDGKHGTVVIPVSVAAAIFRAVDAEVHRIVTEAGARLAARRVTL